ncbi:MAG: aminoacyl-tRNA hydrolase [Candidatus Saccharibacteria bacterium]|nr:aminoacyl-tRNA hydrolase [Candidatus Saccharibacteria bacterium]
MGLFDRKKTNYYESQPLYTLGNNQTLLVIGLGNVGSEYSKNRHNVGFMAIDRYKDSHDFTDWMEKKDLKCHLTTGNVGSTRVILAKPTTMMNLSGESVQKIMQFYKISETDTLVVHDELDIDFGTIRTRVGGGSAGHNGIKSLITHAGAEFGRIRVGIGPKEPSKIDSADFVLQDFSDQQHEKLPKILKEVCALIDERTAGPLQDATISI